MNEKQVLGIVFVIGGIFAIGYLYKKMDKPLATAPDTLDTPERTPPTLQEKSNTWELQNYNNPYAINPYEMQPEIVEQLQEVVPLNYDEKTGIATYDPSGMFDFSQLAEVFNTTAIAKTV